MKPTLPLILAALVSGGLSDRVAALESEPLSRPGIRNVQLVTDVPAIVPGRPFTVALRLEPMPGHHTYWRGPGIVGVATGIDWNLPAGFSAGPILWPPPSRVIMAGIVAHGFKEPVLLLTEITPPAKLTTEEVALSARVSWMACAVSCNPGFADLALSLSVADAGIEPTVDNALAESFAAAREVAPKPAPRDWRFEARLAAPDRIELIAAIPGLTVAQADSLHFYCDDMQVDSDEPQVIDRPDTNAPRFRISLARPEFAPKHPTVLSGVLHCPGGWPGIGSEHVEISAPWPEGTFPNEI